MEFGIWHAQTEVGGLFLQRYGFSPRLTCTIEPPASIWTPLHLPVLRVPITSEEGHTTLILLSSLLSWIEEYEQWVQENLGEDYRKWSLSAGQSHLIFWDVATSHFAMMSFIKAQPVDTHYRPHQKLDAIALYPEIKRLTVAHF